MDVHWTSARDRASGLAASLCQRSQCRSGVRHRWKVNGLLSQGQLGERVAVRLDAAPPLDRDVQGLARALYAQHPPERPAARAVAPEQVVGGPLARLAEVELGSDDGRFSGQRRAGTARRCTCSRDVAR